MARDYGITEATESRKHLLGGHPPIIHPGTLATDGATEQVLERGTVLGRLAANGKYVGLDPDVTTGAETAVSILMEDVTVPDDADAKAIVLVHGDVFEDGLVFVHDGITTSEIETAYADLQDAGIYVRAR